MKNLIIDGNNILHRAYWISNQQKKTDSDTFFHVHIFLSSLKVYIKTYKPDNVYCCWDERQSLNSNPRKQLSKDYKSNRNKEYAQEVYSKIKDIKEILNYLGVQNVFPYQYEADDAMYILSRHLPGKKIIVTVDKDLHQSITSDVTIFDPAKKKTITESDVGDIKKFILTKAIQGDKSDNIEGLQGFGKKTLEKYFNGEFKLTAEQEQIVNSNLELVDLSKGGISCKEELEFVLSQCKGENKLKPDYNLFVDKCKELQLNAILSKIEEWNELFFFQSIYTTLLEELFADK
jgi:5'-3' exonuclease